MFLLIRIKWQMFWNSLRTMTWVEVVKVMGLGSLGLLFSLGLYWGFMRLLFAIKNVEIIGGLLMMKLLSMVLLTIFFMVVFSSILASLTTMYFAHDLSFLMVRPLSFRTVFLFKALETSVYASWMVVLAFIPFILAYARVHELSGGGFYVMLTGLSIPFLIIACCLGMLVSLILLSLFPSSRVREVMLLLGILVGCTVYIFIRWLEPEKLVRADTFEVVLQYIALLEAPTAAYLPSWWLASAVTAFLSHQHSGIYSYAGILFGTALLSVFILVALAEKAYYKGWTTAQEGSRRKIETPLGREWSILPSWLKNPWRALAGKDMLIFFRDPNQWSQLLLLMALVIFYLMSIDKLPLDTLYLKSLISFLNIGMVGFVLAAIALRFIFPMISMEGKSWWAIRSAPLDMSGFLLEKFLVSFLPLMILGVALVWMSNRLLQVEPFVIWLSNGTIAVMSIALAALGVGLGAVFPRFQVENVAQIETSPGGILYMVFALFYVGLTLSLESILMKMHFWSRMRGISAWDLTTVMMVLGGLFLINGVMVVIPMWCGKISLERMDV